MSSLNCIQCLVPQPRWALCRDLIVVLWPVLWQRPQRQCQRMPGFAPLIGENDLQSGPLGFQRNGGCEDDTTTEIWTRMITSTESAEITRVYNQHTLHTCGKYSSIHQNQYKWSIQYLFQFIICLSPYIIFEIIIINNFY